MMKYRYYRLLKITAIVLAYNISTIFPSQSQIIPDTTLPNNTQIKLDNNSIFIENGTKSGGNLFHSFKEFSVSNGISAYFNNSSDVQNIISRVTGNSVSSIDGLIHANGSANLFLINPNGVVFGQNAQLNIGGSFIGSTANSIKFADGFEFIVSKPQVPPILTISTPIGLQFRSNPQAIRVEGIGHNLIGSPFSPAIGRSNLIGLRVLPTRTIALVGGNIISNGGMIVAEGGRVELGSVGNNSFVNLVQTSSGWNLSYDNTTSFQDIQLSKRSLVDASGLDSGSVQVQGRNIRLNDGSVILIQNQGLTTGGKIGINASNSLDISGTDPIARIAGSLRNETLGFGKAGDIIISTQRLTLQDGGQINSLTFSPAKSGDVIVNASDSVNVVGFSPRNPAISSLISAGTFSSGDSGSILISTPQLIATNGGSIGVPTLGFGRGGNLTINATDFVMIEGYAPYTFQSSVLSATSTNTGNAGDLTINTSKLIVRDGAKIDSSTIASGHGGSITINASNSVDIEGTTPNSPNSTSVTSSANIESQVVQNFLNLAPIPSGNSGDIAISTPVLNITGNALVSVRNQGTGNAGTINITANRINVANDGSITAATKSGEGGNLFVNTQNLLLDNSTITTTASGNGNGGNININASVIAASNNSSITANAFEGRGGNIQINTKGLFLSPDSQITASSERGINGTVQINADTSLNDVTAKPEIVLQTPEITSICQGRSSGNSEFVITGTGGLAPNPENLPDTQSTWQRNSHDKSSQFTTSPDTTEIVEAQGWVKNPDGSVTLTAQANIVNPDATQSANSCDSDTNNTG
ncbi:filamentous hemagglutinin N-terminal domain-containing protein [Anabaena sp. UHCC 0399]|uniref:two-partner secretion domain-containing protein n=1 Tax=Anabaena sp. UHCC 0399 TaxID=3110238 RepID=UPI002B21B08E|nr:filamentous hemagglutinin N-terminal domain-containing protein [Anabaena sp. UHCC 0399]MEA5567613.1 filamentous hemagglutinin N-terminal domain-containing protein [Anabaena sp. UHCC 0399]